MVPTCARAPFSAMTSSRAAATSGSSDFGGTGAEPRSEVNSSIITMMRWGRTSAGSSSIFVAPCFLFSALRFSTSP